MHFLITFACGLAVVGLIILLIIVADAALDYFKSLPGHTQDLLAAVFVGIPLATAVICCVGSLVVRSFHIPI